MIRHIVAFKLKEFDNDTQKSEALIDIKKRIEELPNRIKTIRRCEVGIDVKKLPSSYDIVLTMDFDHMDDLNFYAIHPDHQDFITYNKDFSIAKASVDYEI